MPGQPLNSSLWLSVYLASHIIRVTNGLLCALQIHSVRFVAKTIWQSVCKVSIKCKWNYYLKGPFSKNTIQRRFKLIWGTKKENQIALDVKGITLWTCLWRKKWQDLFKKEVKLMAIYDCYVFIKQSDSGKLFTFLLFFALENLWKI